MKKKQDNEFTIDVTVAKIRNIGGNIKRSTGFDIIQAEAFLSLYAETLHDKLDAAIMEFMKEKLG